MKINFSRDFSKHYRQLSPKNSSFFSGEKFVLSLKKNGKWFISLHDEERFLFEKSKWEELNELIFLSFIEVKKEKRRNVSFSIDSFLWKKNKFEPMTSFLRIMFFSQVAHVQYRLHFILLIVQYIENIFISFFCIQQKSPFSIRREEEREREKKHFNDNGKLFHNC